MLARGALWLAAGLAASLALVALMPGGLLTLWDGETARPSVPLLAPPVAAAGIPPPQVEPPPDPRAPPGAIALPSPAPAPRPPPRPAPSLAAPILPPSPAPLLPEPLPEPTLPDPIRPDPLPETTLPAPEVTIAAEADLRLVEAEAAAQVGEEGLSVEGRLAVAGTVAGVDAQVATPNCPDRRPRGAAGSVFRRTCFSTPLCDPPALPRRWPVRATWRSLSPKRSG